MLLIAVGVVVTYIGCDSGAVIQAPERGSAKNLLEAEAQGAGAVAAESSVVYFTKDITPAGLKKAYDALKLPPPEGAKVAVKLSTGEPPNSNYLRASLIKDFIQSLPGANIVECNTIYGGKRGTSREHDSIATLHGFTTIATVDIMDRNGSISIPVTVSGAGTHLKGENFVGKNFVNYDYYVILSHFKGHSMAGLGGAIKNISIGIGSGGAGADGSTVGKSWIHSAGAAKKGFSAASDKDFQESMAEAGKAVVDYLNNHNGKILYINVMNNISIDCDCNGNPAKPEIPDIGILSSLDPVALDRACVELVKNATGKKSLLDRIASKQGERMISRGEEINLGSQTYKLVDLDKTTSINSPEREIPPIGAACKLVRPE
jgi:uncharacterized Fe-S center protein